MCGPHLLVSSFAGVLLGEMWTPSVGGTLAGVILSGGLLGETWTPFAGVIHSGVILAGVLQAVGYNAVEVEDWESAGPSSGTESGGQEVGGRRGTGTGAGGGGGGEGGGAGELGRLEALLLEKNRRMEHELTQAKVRQEFEDRVWAQTS